MKISYVDELGFHIEAPKAWKFFMETSEQK
jgi:hypothetical protein